MKLKSNYALLGFLAAGSLFASGSASASFLLAGAYDFDGTNNQEFADVTHPGFVAIIGKTPGLPNTSSSAIGGSTDATYGPGTAAGHGGHTYPSASAGNDGYLVARSTSNIQFDVYTTSSVPKKLTALLFDASTTASNLVVTYVLSGGGTGTLSGPTQTSGSGSYSNFEYDLSGLGIIFATGVNDQVTFIIRTVTGTANVDNIALTAIPEPGSLIALGCVMGSGLLLRARRRSSVCAEVSA